MLKRFTSYLPSSVKEQVVWSIASRASETIQYREHYFTSYELARTRSLLTTTPIRQSIRYNYSERYADEMKAIADTVSAITDVRYPLLVPEFQLTQECSIANGVLTAPVKMIGDDRPRIQPWAFADKTFFYNHRKYLAFSSPNPVYTDVNVTFPVPDDTIDEPYGFCCPLRLATVSSDIIVDSLLYKATEIQLIFNFKVPRDYSYNRDAVNNPSFTTLDLPPRYSRIEDT